MTPEINTVEIVIDGWGHGSFFQYKNKKGDGK